MKKILFTLIMAMGLFLGTYISVVEIQAQPIEQPTYTPNPTLTPRPTYTDLPTYTPNPTYTPCPTDTPTPYPTSTLYPTATIYPTQTPYPTSTPYPDQHCSVPSNAYYVSPTGNDSNPGTLNQPWRTIQKAANTLNPGETVYIRGGVYNEMVTLPKSGAPNQYITFRAYPGEIPTLDGTNTLYAGFRAYGEKRWIIIDGFEVRNYIGKGILFEPEGARTSNLIIRNNEVHDITGFGINIQEADDFEIYGNEVYNISPYTGIFVINSTGGIIHHNTVYLCDGNGIMLSIGSDNNEIYSNVVYRNSCGVDQRYAGIAVEVDSELNTIHNNLIVYNCHAGYLTNSPNNKVHNNTIYENTVTQVSSGDWSGSYPIGNTYKNNIFVVPHNANPTDPTHRAVTFWGSGYDPYDNVFDHNLYFYVDGPDMYGMVAAWPDVYSFTEWQAIGKESNGVLGDPLFMDILGWDFSLQLGSPAIDAGVDVGLLYYGPAPDIGAFEFVE